MSTAGRRIGRMRRVGAAAVAALVLAACGTTGEPVGTATVLDGFAQVNDLTRLPRARVTVGAGARALSFDVLVADTPVARARGLQGVAEVPDGVGMLFVFEDPPGPGGRPGFWMLDTLVPLDIAFVADDVVVGVATMVPCTARPCPTTHPGVAYDIALETAAGVLIDAGVTVGDPFLRDAEAGGERPR